MKIKVSLFIISAVLMLTSGEASAAFPHFTPNQFKTAESLDPGMTQTGIDFSIGSGIKNYYADIRYGLGAMVELGAKLGASSMTIDSEDKAGALVGIDLK